MRSRQKKGLHDLCEINFVGKSCTKNFRASLGKFGQKSFAPPKFASSYTYVDIKCLQKYIDSWHCDAVGLPMVATGHREQVINKTKSRK